MVICSVAHTKIPRTYSNISLKKIYQPKDNKETSCHLKNLKKFVETLHCVKSVRIRSCSGPYFLAFGLNSERFGVSLRIQSECGKIRTRITRNTDTFHAVFARDGLKEERYS